MDEGTDSHNEEVIENEDDHENTETEGLVDIAELNELESVEEVDDL